MSAFITPIDQPDPTAGYGKQGKLGNYGDAGVPSGMNSATGGAAGVVSRPSAQELGLEYPHDPAWQQRGPRETVDQQGAQHILQRLAMVDNPDGGDHPQPFFPGFHDIFPVEPHPNLSRWGGRFDIYELYGGSTASDAEMVIWHALDQMNQFEFGMDPGTPDTFYGAPVFFPVFASDADMFDNTPIAHQVYLPWAHSLGPRVFYDDSMPSLNDALFGPSQQQFQFMKE
jgi:hypothetical protein